RKSAMAAHPEPKDRNDLPEVKALEHLEQLEERVLDANLNLSQKLSDISQLAAQGKDSEAKMVIEEIRQQQEEQRELIQKQEKLVEQLNLHIEEHERIKSDEKRKDERKKSEEQMANDSSPAVRDVPQKEQSQEIQNVRAESYSVRPSVYKLEHKNINSVDVNVSNIVVKSLAP
ncbi:hypothetical protein PMAYCL1PPCAC_33345, partial [Pristionchus mayeri]